MRKAILQVVAVLVILSLSAAPALAEGEPQGNPNLIEGSQLVGDACDPGAGETSGDKKKDDPDAHSVGAVHGDSFFVGCSVPLPDAAGFVTD